jgi:hypothetical protein
MNPKTTDLHCFCGCSKRPIEKLHFSFLTITILIQNFPENISKAHKLDLSTTSEIIKKSAKNLAQKQNIAFRNFEFLSSNFSNFRSKAEFA